jgi:hypothetical protein
VAAFAEAVTVAVTLMVAALAPAVTVVLVAAFAEAITVAVTLVAVMIASVVTVALVGRFFTDRSTDDRSTDDRSTDDRFADDRLTDGRRSICDDTNGVNKPRGIGGVDACSSDTSCGDQRCY